MLDTPLTTQATMSCQGQPALCRYQAQAHHNASGIVEPGTAPCRHQLHFDANAIAESETAPQLSSPRHRHDRDSSLACHQQACPAAQHLLATSSIEDDTTEATSHQKP